MKITLLMLLLTVTQIFSAKTGEYCSSSLECSTTGCCQNQVCVATSTCEKNMTIFYVIIGVVGFVFLVLTFIYFILTIKSSRENVRKLQQKMMVD
jgi:hypothetical protein